MIFTLFIFKMIPALTDNKLFRLSTVTSMYVFQGIQMGLMLVAIPAYLANHGATPAQIGAFIGIIMLPWSLKILCAPLMDRFTFLAMGRRRPWVIAGLIGAAAGFLAMAMVQDPLNNLFLLNMTAMSASIFTAVVDVAIDGMAIDVVPLEEQSRANSMMWGGKVLGAAGTAAGAAYLLANFGMPLTFGVASAFSLAFCLVPILFVERPGERRFPWSSGQASEYALQFQVKNWTEIGTNLLKVVFLPSSIFIILVAFLHGITYGLFDALMPVITVNDLGWEDTEFSNIAAIGGLIAGVVGMLIGALIVKKAGKKGAMVLMFMALLIAGVIVASYSGIWEIGYSVELFVILIYTFRTLLFIAMFTTCMALCWKKVAATQFALYMAVGNLGISVGAALIGPLEAFLDHRHILFVFGGVALVAVLFVRGIKVDHHIKKLNKLQQLNT
jgi:PAT family beta-lactamase induction signal transducer AmpG